MTPLQLMQEDIAVLQAKVDEIKRQDKITAIGSIKQFMAEAGVTLADLGKPSKTRAKAPAKYRNPADPTQTWNGRGRKPKWALSYASLSDLLIPA